MSNSPDAAALADAVAMYTAGRRFALARHLLSDRLPLVRKLRSLSNHTQESIADIIGVSRAAVTQWENGYTTPTPNNMVDYFAVVVNCADLSKVDPETARVLQETFPLNTLGEALQRRNERRANTADSPPDMGAAIKAYRAATQRKS